MDTRQLAAFCTVVERRSFSQGAGVRLLLELERDIFVVRATGRVETRAARAFLEFAAERL